MLGLTKEENKLLKKASKAQERIIGSFTIAVRGVRVAENAKIKLTRVEHKLSGDVKVVLERKK